MSQELFDAINKGTVEQINALLGANPSLASSRNQAGVSAIMMALYCGRNELTGLLLNAGAEVDLFEAAALGDTKMLIELIEKKSSAVNEISPDGFSPLHLACFMGQIEAVRTLIGKGAILDTPSRNGADLKPINSAAACRNLEAGYEIVKALLRAGADPGATQKGGYSALHSAAANGNLPLVKLLVNAGADASALANDKKNALQLAKERNRNDVVDFLS